MDVSFHHAEPADPALAHRGARRSRSRRRRAARARRRRRSADRKAVDRRGRPPRRQGRGGEGSKPKAAAAKTQRAAAPAAHLARGKVAVSILNGNGRQGAAASAASRVSRRGYRIGGVANAPRSDFTRNLVMYRRGFEGEGRRLARDLGIRIVGPLDGLRASQLHGAHTVVVVGA